MPVASISAADRFPIVVALQEHGALENLESGIGQVPATGFPNEVVDRRDHPAITKLVYDLIEAKFVRGELKACCKLRPTRR